MATNTSNYNLVKPALSDAPPDITKLNDNWDISMREHWKTKRKKKQSLIWQKNM